MYVLVGVWVHVIIYVCMCVCVCVNVNEIFFLIATTLRKEKQRKSSRNECNTGKIVWMDLSVRRIFIVAFLQPPYCPSPPSQAQHSWRTFSTSFTYWKKIVFLFKGTHTNAYSLIPVDTHFPQNHSPIQNKKTNGKAINITLHFPKRKHTNRNWSKKIS